MATVTYINNLGEKIDLGNNKPIILEKIEGISLTKNSILSSKPVGNDGVIINSSNIDAKDISIQIAIVSNDIVEVEKQREKLIRIFNPKLAGKLVYKNNLFEREIDVEIESTFNFAKSLGGKIQRGNIEFIGASGIFKNTVDLGEIISTWIGGWKFKFRLPFRFKQKGESKKNIYNEGHVETPVEIIFKGPALNPKIANLTTGEFIKVDRELTSDDTLYITTAFGNKKVEIERNGVRKNAFHYIDLDSTFFQLKVGDNLIEYSTENELEPQSVEIRYRNRYLGV